MDYKVIRDEESMLAERESWNSICDRMPGATPFQTWEWNYIWWKHNEPKDSLYIIKAFEDGTVFGYAPLVVKNKRAEFIGDINMDYGLFVVCYKEMTVIEGFIAKLLDEKFDLNFQEMAAKSAQLHTVEKILEGKKGYLVCKTTRTSYVRVTDYASFEEYYKLLGQSLRNKTIRPALKAGFQLNREGITDRLLEEIQEVFYDRQEVRGGKSNIDWAISVMGEMEAEKLLNVYMARKDGEAAGFLISLFYRGAQYIWLAAFKMAYKNSFPGHLLYYMSIKEAFESGNHLVDFMRGDYNYKTRWERSIDTNYTVQLFHNRFEFLKHKTIYQLKPKIKRFVYAHPILRNAYKDYTRRVAKKYAESRQEL